MANQCVAQTQSAYGFSLLIKGLLESGVTRAPEQEIVSADSTRLTYREFAKRVGRLASGLHGLGVEPGDTVAIMDWDTNRYLECFFAVPMMGAVLHTVNVRLPAEQILYTINHAEDDVILVNSEFLPLLQQIWDRVDAGKKLVLLSDIGKPTQTVQTSLSFDAEYEALLAGADPWRDFPDFDENTRATTFYTTGTTGQPKGVYFSHRQLVLHTLVVRSTLAAIGQGWFKDEEIYMPITPFFHVHAWGFPYIATMLGAKQVYCGRYLADSVVALFQREKVTLSHCVPTILRMLLDSAKTKGIPLSGWKMIIGGAALPQALAREALELGVEVYAGYGMSETCPGLTLSGLMPKMTSWTFERQVEIRCKAGRPHPLTQLRIVDAEMNDLPHDGKTSGELVARAPWLTQGYLKDPKGSEKLWAGGWLHTGDVATIDTDGYVKITDRLKDVIRSGCEWISSLQLEDLILRHPGVTEAAVIGVPDPKWIERPLGLLVAKPCQEVSEEQIRTHLQGFVEKGIITSYSIPDRIVFVEALPKTSVGKLDKKLLRERYASKVVKA
ncbi:MAG: long-chain fatty acid--CoA ligase [Verrucomicrobia bacterium]|nr:long-chain fatty acid--CoA ligase [Verrucomicrobiota bacterium]